MLCFIKKDLGKTSYMKTANRYNRAEAIINGMSIIILFILVLRNINLSAQNETIQSDIIFVGHVVSSDWIDYGLTIGFDFSKYLYGEINYYRSYIWEASGFPTLSTTMIYGAEFSYFDNFVLAPNIQEKNSCIFL